MTLEASSTFLNFTLYICKMEIITMPSTDVLNERGDRMVHSKAEGEFIVQDLVFNFTDLNFLY